MSCNENTTNNSTSTIVDILAVNVGELYFDKLSCRKVVITFVSKQGGEVNIKGKVYNDVTDEYQTIEISPGQLEKIIDNG